MTGLRARVSIAVGALIITAGVAVPFAAAAGKAAAGAPQAQGTDVYQATTVTSWPEVKAAGNTFVGVEAVQGATITNSQYQSQVSGATSAGLFVMPYVYADPAKVGGAAQFARAWQVIDGIPGVPYAPGGLLLPIALDMESDLINFPTEPCYGLTQSAMVAWIRAFVTAAEQQTGVTPVLYTSPGWWRTCTGDSTAFSGLALWIADYGVSSPPIPPGWPGYTFWQSSNAGSVTGITGPADIDLMQGAPATLDAAAGTSGGVQVQSLTGLAGQPVSYTAAGLNAGLSMSPAGLFTWTPVTPVGSYPVTVTPAETGVVPSTVSFTFNVHGSITVTTGNRVSTAGTPVAVRVPTSGPDQAAGFMPSLTATGLPTGLSISPSGLISGWPSKPGTFQVTVAATDGLGGTGSASFAWTVTAAGDAGFAGTIRQAGGSGKCLDDPGSNTANGTRVDLWSCTGHANQKWTVVPDGTIRVLGKCLAASGTSVVLWGCSAGFNSQEWQAGTGGELVNAQSGKCLSVPGANAANGSRPAMAACASTATSPGEHWYRPAAAIYSGDPGKCLAVSGPAVVLAGCANTAAQHWTAQPDGTIRLGGKCLTEAAAAAGSGLSIGSCSTAAAGKWTLVAAGPLATELASAASGLCVTAPSAASGTAVVIEACAATPAATWHVE